MLWLGHIARPHPSHEFAYKPFEEVPKGRRFERDIELVFKVRRSGYVRYLPSAPGRHFQRVSFQVHII